MGTTNRPTAGGRPEKSKPTISVLEGGQARRDPLNVNKRLYLQLGRLLDDMEAADREDRMTFPQRIQALVAVGRIQVLFSTLRKQANDEPGGSEVRKYSAAFQAPHGNRIRKGHPGGPESFDFDSQSDDDGDSPDAA